VNPWKVILATMVIFTTGVVTGGLVGRYSQAMRPHRPQHSTNGHPALAMSPGFLRFEFLRRAQRELDLSAEQREQVDKLIGESQERMKKLWEPITPRIREELHQTKAQFRALLTPEQQTRFDELLKHQQQRMHDQRRSGSEAGRLPENPSTNAPVGKSL
jgi:Spy/CpxP family protein refolding chaperone